MYTTDMLTIVLGTHSPLTLHFRIRSNPIAELWLERMQQRSSWPISC
jgi:hypothetical protein